MDNRKSLDFVFFVKYRPVNFVVKAKPVVKQGRKATGLKKIAGLPQVLYLKAPPLPFLYSVVFLYF